MRVLFFSRLKGLDLSKSQPCLKIISIFHITFLPRSKSLLISWLQSPSAVILEPPKIKSDTVCTVSPHTRARTRTHTVLVFPARGVGTGGGVHAGSQGEVHGDERKSMSAQSELGEQHFPSPQRLRG